jgi:hypothetical protein
MLADTYGINFDLLTGYDLTGATVLSIEVADRFGTVRVLSATVAGAATEGVVRRVTQVTDFPKGLHEVQAVVEFGPTKKLRSTPVQIEVDAFGSE